MAYSCARCDIAVEMTGKDVKEKNGSRFFLSVWAYDSSLTMCSVLSNRARIPFEVVRTKKEHKSRLYFSPMQNININ